MGMEGGISLVVINSIKSNEVNGQIISEDRTQAQTYYKRLESQRQFGIFTLASIEANGFKPEEEEQAEEEEKAKIIAGVVSGVFVVLGIIIIIVIFKKKSFNEDVPPSQKLKKEEITSLHFDDAQ